jgi:hypothetical protein
VAAPLPEPASADLDHRLERSGKHQAPLRAVFVFATFLQPHEKVKWMFDGYRSAFRDTGMPGGGGMAYMPLVYTAETEEEAEKGARDVLVSRRQVRAAIPQPAGLCAGGFNVQALKGTFTGRTARCASSRSSS